MSMNSEESMSWKSGGVPYAEHLSVGESEKLKVRSIVNSQSLLLRGLTICTPSPGLPSAI